MQEHLSFAPGSAAPHREGSENLTRESIIDKRHFFRVNDSWGEPRNVHDPVRHTTTTGLAASVDRHSLTLQLKDAKLREPLEGDDLDRTAYEAKSRIRTASPDSKSQVDSRKGTRPASVARQYG